MSNVVYTVGHSTRSAGGFVSLLKAHGVTVLADVRTVRRSRHNPQFNGDALAVTLAANGIRYVPLPGLGGFRKTTPDSPNSNTGVLKLAMRMAKSTIFSIVSL